MRHHETDGTLLFLQQVGHQAGGTRQQWHPLERQERVTRIQEHSRNRSGDVERQGAADQLGQQLLDSGCDLNMAGSDTRLGRNLNETQGAWIATPMQRVAESWNRTLRLAVLAHHLGDGGLTIFRLGFALGDFCEKLTRGFRGTQHNRTATEYSSRHRTLQGLRGGGERHARHLHAGHKSVLRDGDQRRIQHTPLRRRRQRSGYQQPEVLSEVD